MRPIRLEMEGFASFRSATVVDFTEADYFALVGPTGSGKSTVIDAVVFALYGTAPRWGRVNGIEYALAPTATRGTVRLVFDVGSHRYQIAREVRRVGRSGVVQQKGVFLERFLDSSAAEATSEQVQTLASELREVRTAVEQLLGLTYNDFTQAVVLPQGRFAEFLTATSGERQDILLKLLGADQYERIRAAASERARDAASRVTQLDAQLADLADATPDAELKASARVNELDALRVATDERLTAIGTLRETARADARRHAELHGEADQLAAVRAPGGVADLRERAASVSSALDAAGASESAAADAWDAARTNLEHLGQRGEWERLAEQWRESAELGERLPGLREQAEAAQDAMKAARNRRDEASASVRTAEQAVDAAAREQSAADEAHREAEARRLVLDRVTTPTGVRDLAYQVAVATEALAEHQSATEAAEVADEKARAEAASAGDGAVERQALGWLDQRRAVVEELARLDAAAADARTSLEATQAESDRSDQAVAQAEQRLQAARDAGVAAGLRAHLAVGDNCPVCERPIDVMPVGGDEGDLAEAQAALDAARDRHRTATEQLRNAEKDATFKAALAKGRRDALAQLEADIAAAYPDAQESTLEASLREALARVEATTAAMRAAGERVREARAARQAAADRSATLQESLAEGWQRFRAARAGLLAWGCPTQEPADLGRAWADLTAWARQLVAELDERELPELRDRREISAATLEQAEIALVSARAVLEEADSAATETTTAEAAASGDLKRDELRAEELRELLRDRPDAAAAATALERVAEAETEEKRARVEHAARREELKGARTAHEAVKGEVQQALQALRAVRDPLVALGAPPLDESNPGTGWDTLVSWATEALARVTDDLDRAETARVSSAATVTEAEAAAMAACAAAGLPIPSVAAATTTIAGALAEARKEVSLVRERIDKGATLLGQRAEAAEQAQVGSLLAENLKKSKFQEWLAGAALDVLVEAASETLHDLSGGQYGLTHDRGDFHVIDHEDAEARRSVRTLSGGETFQTSLALALALSDQLSSLSSSSARLESLFLDEGFGTLDADSLETVAVTLERLAQGDRMVGVVTHVPALAERVPTRYVVRRDSQSSRVVREG